ncbi:hypothetical protein CHS0354_028518 [Potamilus streckersoni]|uniref:Methyltransferase FkbM domain-containing protein n=1 Tax=Potamilus streckersoni TaxID=2493646 RepID=A0AAE0RN73_9BIVA|nr:hypothetical protein CHS0354_028518 [Potamilus streckersoni]
MIGRFRSLKILVVSGLLCLITLTFFAIVRYYPVKVKTKHVPNNKQELSRGAVEPNFDREQTTTHPTREIMRPRIIYKKVNNSTGVNNFVVARGKSSNYELSTVETNSIRAQVSDQNTMSKNLRRWQFSFGNNKEQPMHEIMKSSQRQGDDIADRNANQLQSVKNGIMQSITYNQNSNAIILPHSVIKHNISSKAPVPFNVLNLTQNLQQVYTLKKQYLSSKDRNFLCVQTITIPSFIVCIFSVKEDVFVSGSLQKTRTWDIQQTKLIQNALNRFPEASFIDVGANIGYFSLLARAMGRTVIAIEPTEATFLRLQEGVVRNKFSDNIILLKYAVSDKRTTVVMGEDDKNQGGIAVAREISGPANISRSVEAITLDDLVSLISTNEIIIKMDIEGYECKALYSSMELLQKFKVRYIFMEWLIMPQNQDKKDTPCPKANILHTLANMYSLGFKPYSLNGNELDINNSGSWTVTDIYWKPADSPKLL